MARYDYVLVGGGLQNGLLALALAERGSSVAIIERGLRLGGNHTWCLHASDVPLEAAWLEPLIVQRWPGYAVRFPALEREVREPYLAVTSARLHDVVSEVARARGFELMLGESVEALGPGRVTLASGRSLDAGLVVDARGPEASSVRPGQGFQK